MLASRPVTVSQQGFTLIESIVAMVLMAIAMTILMTIFFPYIEKSGQAQYQVRASALGQSMMTTILSRGFDENSDPNGGLIRCDDNSAPACSTSLGVDNGELDASRFDDVDDYNGCWYTTDASRARCQSSPYGTLTDVLGEQLASQYNNFSVDVVVNLVNQAQLTQNQPATAQIFKKIELTIYPGKYMPVYFEAYRGNY